jgi:dipeptidyl aminopeptidase/acylaminoacyl peptidase
MSQRRPSPFLFAFICVGLAPFVRAAEVTPSDVLVLGPVGLPVLVAANDASARAPDFVCEIDARTAWPRAGVACALTPAANSAFEARAVGDGTIEWSGSAGSVGFVAAYFHVDRFGPVKLGLAAPGDLRLFVDGKELAHAGSSSAGSTTVSAEPALATGLHRLLVRIEANAAGRMRLTADARAAQNLAFTIDPQHAPASYEDWRGLVGLSGLMLAPGGGMLAYRETRRDVEGEGSQTLLHVVDVATRRIVAPALLGAGASAVAWRRDGDQLLVRRGASLFTWNRGDGAIREVLRDEPGLGAVSWSDDGSFLVFASTRGAPDAPKTSGGAKRRTELREKLSDWPTEPHLHLLMLESGARRRLTSTGDWTFDAFAIGPQGVNLVYLRSTPQPMRPWMRSELHVLGIATGEDRTIATLTMGFENRPGLTSFALSHDGRRVAFTGPPSELGAGAEPNAFDPDAWVVDLDDGKATKVTADFAPTCEGHLQWLSDGRLAFLSAEGALNRVVVAADAGGAWSLTALPPPRDVETMLDVHGSSDGAHFALVGTATDRLPALFVDDQVFHAPNAALQERLLLPAPMDVSFTNAGGTRIEAWLYRPAPSAFRPSGKLPLITYYYGGATPTPRGFNELHQFLVANGYALLVVNPRGAAGYGEAFSAEHANDWGTKAGADILEAVAKTLAQHSDLDAAKVGGYGGSYGGFMTMWLVSHSKTFAAAVSMYGISNLASYYGDGVWGFTYGDQAMAANLPWQNPQWWTDHSPLFSADDITTPLLLMHGEVDTNVPVGESEQMFTALKLLGRPVELVRFPGEDHGLRGTWANRVQHRTMLLEWFDKWLKDQGAAWDARWK